MDQITVAVVSSSSPEYAGVYALREEILRKPLGMSLKNEDLSRDHTDIILAGKRNDEVVACLLLHHVNDNDVQLRQMAVAADCQGKGIGRKLVVAAEEYAASKGYKNMVLHARKTAVPFYAGMQYKVSGEEFTEVNIPHLLMSKIIG